MKIPILPLFLLLIVSCANSDAPEERETVTAPEVAAQDIESPFQGLGIRYDGYYRNDAGGAVYLIRFFPDGRAVLINGTEDVAQELPPYLHAAAEGDPALGWYNVPVTVQEDSIFFKTFPLKGEISYSGNVPATSVVRLLRHSHINGSREIKEYIFQPDTPVSQQDRP